MKINWETILKQAQVALDEYINKYNVFLDNYHNNYVSKSTFENERTLSIFIGNEIEKLLNNEFQVFTSQEFPINMNGVIDDETFTKIQKDIWPNKKIYSKTSTTWEKFNVDIFYEISSSNEFSNVFIECKRGNSFQLTEFIRDFLKFLLYTNNAKISSTFIYLNFNNKSGSPKYINEKDSLTTLNKNIENNVETLKRNNVYIFENDPKNSYNNSEIIYEIVALEHLNKELTDENNNKIDFKSVTHNLNHYILTESIFFNRSIATSKLVKFNYSSIVDLFDKMFKTNFYKNELEKYKMDDGEFFNCINSCVDWKNNFLEIRNYFINFQKLYTSRAVVNAEENMLRTSKRSSLILLTIFSVAAKMNNIDCTFNLEIEKWDPETDYDKSNRNKIEKLYDIYTKNEEYIENFKRLSFFLFIYIRELYELIFEFDDNNRLIDKEEYKIFKKQEEAQLIIAKLSSHLEAKKTLDPSSSLEEQLSYLVDVFLKKYIKN